MGERNSGTELPPLTVSHDDALANPELRDQYLQERVARIKAGERIWMLRGFETEDTMESGAVYDYYAKRDKRAFTDGNDLDGYHMYQIGPDGIPIHLNTEPIMNLYEARQRLEAAVGETDI